MRASYAVSWPRKPRALGWLSLATGSVLLGAALWAGESRTVRWLWPLTPSIAPGLYTLQPLPASAPIRRGEIAVFAVPARVAELVRSRTYLHPDLPLMKPVAALAGDRVCTEGQQVTVNGRSYGPVRRTDQAGRTLPQYHYCGPLPAGQVYVLSPHPHSFDSRHFGPVAHADLIGKARPVWTW